MKPDVLICWPMHLDYPLWREFIHNNRERFNKVIVIFTQMNTGKDYRPWLQGELNKDSIITITSRTAKANEDWRNIAVNEGLSYSDAEWVWFTEPDFFPNQNLWEELKGMEGDMIGVKQDTRLHPCCLFIKRDLLNKTSRDFSANPPSHDHFGQIQKDLVRLSDYITAFIINPKFYIHMNGLSQNMYLLQIGEQPNYEPEKFKEYCQKCLQIDLPIQPEIKKLLEEYICE